jgi:SPP1 gp7 family putative phage head morphogenesis protein
MQEHLAIIAQGMVSQIMGRVRNLPASQALQAIKSLDVTGIAEYRSVLTTGLSIIATDALTQVRREVPKKKNVKLSELEDNVQLAEFDRLPGDVQRKIKSQVQLMLGLPDADGTQISDIKKAILFQYASSFDTTDSLDLLEADLAEAAEDFISGSSVNGAAGALASQTVNDARNSFLFDDDVSEEIDAYEFVNGDPVSAICADLNGTVFSAKDPNLFRYTPPLHFNCDSYIIAILKGNLGGAKITQLKPSTAKLEAQIQFADVHSCRRCMGL